VKTVILTDSAADMSPAQARQYGVEIVPLWILFGDERLRDGIDISRATFYERFAQVKDLPRSEPLDEAGFAAAFAKHVEAGDQVVAPLVSSKLSKTYENAKAAAARFGDSVRVVDSETLSGGLFLQALAAAEMVGAGAAATDVVEALERAKTVQHGFQIMPDMTYLGRSGRLNKAIVAFGTMLKVNPILQVKNGAVEAAGQTLTYDKAKDLIVDIVGRNVKDVGATRFAVGHTNAPELAETMAAKLRAKLGGTPKTFLTYDVGPTVAVNVGTGAIAIFLLANV
jgi:DegV family protein with EDD domain